MPSHRFFVADLAPPVVHLDPEESHHARRVMRIETGDTVDLFDGQGTTARATVCALKPDLALQIIERTTLPPLAPRITLAVALPKGDRAAMLIEKAAELGADVLVPLRTARSVVDPRQGKLDRLQRIALEAAKQCGRAWMMSVEPPMDFTDLLRQTGHDTRLIADTRSASPPPDAAGFPPHGGSELPSLLGRGKGRGFEHGAPQFKPHPPPLPKREGCFSENAHRIEQDLHTHQSLLILIGPEGGWTDDERHAAAASGFTPWSFNRNILRIETAALAALAILRQHV